MVRIIIGSTSDIPVIEETIKVLKELEVSYKVAVLSAHRTPVETKEFVDKGEEEGAKVFIAAAGKAAHLPGVVASYTTLPVIGLPIKTSDLGGVDSLLSIVQMPSGVPVATVAINGGRNAGILAAQMLAIKDDKLTEKLVVFKEEQRKQVLDSNIQVKEL